MEAVTVLRRIEVQLDKGGILDGERRPLDCAAALQKGGLPVIVGAGVPVRRVPQEGIPDYGIIPVVNLCRGGRETVTGFRKRYAAESGIIRLHRGIPLFLRFAQIPVSLNEGADPLLNLRPAQTDLRIALGIADDKPLGTVLHTAPAAIGKLPPPPTADPILVLQVRRPVCGCVLLGVEDGDTELPAVVGGALPQDAVDLLVGNGKSGGLFALRFPVDQ